MIELAFGRAHRVPREQQHRDREDRGTDRHRHRDVAGGLRFDAERIQRGLNPVATDQHG